MLTKVRMRAFNESRLCWTRHVRLCTAFGAFLRLIRTARRLQLDDVGVHLKLHSRAWGHANEVEVDPINASGAGGSLRSTRRPEISDVATSGSFSEACSGEDYFRSCIINPTYNPNSLFVIKQTCYYLVFRLLSYLSLSYP